MEGAVEYGITDNFQVGVSWVAFQKLFPKGEDNETGIGDLGVGFKYAFDEIEDYGVQFAVGFETTFPTGDVDKDLTEGFRVYEPFFIFSKDFGSTANMHLHLSCGILDRAKKPDEEGEDGDANVGDGEEEEEDEIPEQTDELEINLGFIYAFADDWRSTLELNWETNEIDGGDETELFLTLGLLWKGLEEFEFGVGVPIGLNDDSADWGVIGMLSYEFEAGE